MHAIMITRIGNIIFCAMLGVLACGANAVAADAYDDAVAHAGRSSEDVKRDAVDQPAEILRLSGIKPGMRVADVLAADGYYSELLSYVVGPKGHVLLLNNAPYDKFADNAWKGRIEKQHLDNVEHRTIDMAHMGLNDNALDAALLIKVYHDLYWVDDKNGWPKIDAGSVLTQLSKAIKPGGIVVVVDHQARPGTGSADAGRLHRIDEAYTRRDFEAHGFEFVKSSDLFKRADDKRELVSYKPPIVGQTDRFIYVFRRKR
jgi:predicted methyltransferase